MKKVLVMLGAIFLVIIIVHSVAAVPVIYDESILGDLPHDSAANPADFLSFDVGSNIYYGWTTSIYNAGQQYFNDGIDPDYATFIIPERLVLDSIIVSMRQIGDNGAWTKAGFELNAYDDDFNYNHFKLRYGGIPVPNSLDWMSFTDHYPAGNYSFGLDNQYKNMDFGEGSFGDSGKVNLAYIWEFKVKVPEPSTKILLGSGLIGLVGFSRKLKK